MFSILNVCSVSLFNLFIFVAGSDGRSSEKQRVCYSIKQIGCEADAFNLNTLSMALSHGKQLT